MKLMFTLLMSIFLTLYTAVGNHTHFKNDCTSNNETRVAIQKADMALIEMSGVPQVRVSVIGRAI